MNKTIVFYTMAMNKGGSERVISTLSNHLVNNGYSIYIICNLFGKSYYDLDDKIKYINLDKKVIKNKYIRLVKKISFQRTKRLKKILNEIKPDLVVAFLPEPSLRITFINKYKTILSERCDPKKEYSNYFMRNRMRKLFKRANGFIFQTKEAEKYYDSIINCPKEVIPNPINNDFIDKKYIGNENSIVNVGRLSKQKNQEMLIKAFSIFSLKHPDYILKIYGLGPLEDYLKQKVLEYNVEKKVVFMGNVDDLYNRLINDKIFVLSSDYEGMPNALMEAMALGLPCISTDCPVDGPKSLIKNYVNGILVPVNNPNLLAEAMGRLADDENLHKKISNNSRKIQDELNLDVITKKWEAFFVSIIDK